jgi:hypothetical protein
MFLMFLKGPLFGMGWVLGSGVAMSRLIGMIVLVEWLGGRRNKHAKRPTPGHGVHRDLIVHARSAILRLEQMLDLLQHEHWEKIPVESDSRRIFTIQ